MEQMEYFFLISLLDCEANFDSVLLHRLCMNLKMLAGDGPFYFV